MKLIMLIAVALTIGPSLAQSSDPHVITGAGLISCGQYIETSDDKHLSLLVVSWTQGFLSGANVITAKTTSDGFVVLPDSASIKAYLDKYCHENPLESPARGAAHLFRELRTSGV